MNTLDILSDSFPHGSPDGHRLGCRTNHCPAPIACHVVQRRYAGDLVFRRRVDSGMTVADIAAAEIAEAVERREAERAANRRIREAMKREGKAAKKMKRWRHGTQIRPTPQPFTAEEVAELRALNAAGKTDTEITKALGRPFGSVTAKRSALGLPRNMPQRKPIQHGKYAGYAAGCQNADDCPSTPTCHAAAKAYWRANAEAKRRRDGVPQKQEEAA